MTMTRLIFYLLLGLAPGLAQARVFRLLGPDDLLPMSTLVCNGTVIKLEKIGEEKEPGGSMLSSKHWKAHVKGLAAFKGVMPPEFDFIYTEKFYPVNGPMEFELVEGQRYRFFLKPATTGTDYISVLETEMDNVWSVEALGAGEPDTSPPLLRDEANRLALTYFQLKQPPTATDPSPRAEARREMASRIDPNIWRVQFWFKNSEVHEAMPDAEALVMGDRTIAPDSWIATGPAKPVSEITSANIGQSCWLRMKPTSKDVEYGTLDLRGKIRAITPKAIILNDAHNTWYSYQRTTLAVEMNDVRAVQIIEP